jgi:hypothetical protein
MAPTFATSAAPVVGQRLAYRLAIPVFALLLFAALAALWRWGPHDLYFDALKLSGFEPFRFPFLDIHAVLAAAQCERAGIDVYLSNPCDALGRVHVYSPLWLAITPGFLDTTSTTVVGVGLDLMLILSLAALIRPATWGEVLILAPAALSPVTVYALERANCDLVIFLLVLGGCAIGRAPRPWRLGCYTLYLIAGLLKYYPLVLLILLARERRRDGLAVAGIAAAAVISLSIRGHADLAKALANIPALSYFAGAFSARDLPFGFAAAFGGIGWRNIIGISLLTILVALVVARTRRTVRLIEPTALEGAGWEGDCLLIGALIVTACFFAGQNVDYRGIYFMLVMPGLVRLHRAARGNDLRQFLERMMAAVLFVTWEDCFRYAFHSVAAAIPGESVRLRAEALFWIGRELVWWWLIAGLAAIVLSDILSTALVGDCRRRAADCRFPAALRTLGARRRQQPG